MKLPHLARWTEARRAIAAAYRERLRDLPLGLPPDDAAAVWNQYVVRVRPAHRDALAHHLRAHGVATEVYYPIPLPQQPALAHLRADSGVFPACERAAAEVLALPIYPSLSLRDIDHITACFAAYFELETTDPPSLP